LGLHPTAAYHSLPNMAGLYDAIIEEVLVDVKAPVAASSLCSLSRRVRQPSILSLLPVLW
jgi:hypothetical protein